MTFPASPINDQTYVNALGTEYLYDSTRTAWKIFSQNVTGITGLQGFTGIQGETGIQGFTGIQGGTGIQGITGSAYSAYGSLYNNGNQQVVDVTSSGVFYEIPAGYTTGASTAFQYQNGKELK